ncbi:MAG: beta-lactamase family protein [Gammaproteobacteria bacterium]|nr:beta-lactamase family protein [Gammaproteobacteria bacterium]
MRLIQHLRRLARPIVILGIAVLIHAPHLSAQPADALREMLQQQVAANVIPGAIVLASRNGQLVTDIVVGYQDTNTGSPMRPDSLFRLYSMSKPITSVAIMMLVEQGRVALDQAVESILPELAGLQVYVSGPLDHMVTEPARRSITLRDLLTHSSGITYHFTGQSVVHAYYRKYGVMRDTPVGRTPEDGEPAHSLNELVGRIGRAPLLHQPGTRFAYSYSTTVLGAVIESVTGQPLDRALDEMVLGPLEMSDTGFFVEDSRLDRFMHNYALGDSGLIDIETPQQSDYRDRGRLLDGGGAIVGSAGDYLRFAQMLANGGELNGVRLLAEATVDQMLSPQVTADSGGTPMAFGFGFAVGSKALGELGQSPADTAGWSGSGNTFFWVNRARREAMVFMTQVLATPPHTATINRLRAMVNALVVADLRAAAVD